MENTLIKIFTSFIMPIAGFFVAKSITGSSEKILKIKNIIYILILAAITFLLYDVQYGIVITLLNLVAIIICFKLIFKRSLFDSFIIGIAVMILMFVSEIILSVIVLPFIPPKMVRSIGLPMVLMNLLMGSFTVLLSKIKFVRKLVNNIFLKFEKSFKIQTILLSLCWIAITSVVCFYMFTSLTNGIGLLIGGSVQACFIFFIITFFRDKSNYITLNEKFESLYGYLENLESYVNAERLNIHEYKNQLSVIRSMSGNKKVLNYIDSIIKDTAIDTDWSEALRNLPSGGFKGLIYYKFIQANSKNLNITIDISKNCRSYFEQMSLEEIKELSRLLGIYLDNAIEASEISSKKNITLEIYKTKKVNIVISNSVDMDVDFKNFNKKGYTSKGAGRGHGLYLAKKIIDKNPNIDSEVNLVNSYYIQKIILK